MLLNCKTPFIQPSLMFLIVTKIFSFEVTVLKSTRETDEAEITVTVTFVKKLDPGDRQCVQLYNIMFRR